MGYLSGLIDRMFYVRWEPGNLARGDIDGVLAAMAAHRKNLGKQLVLLNIIPDQLEVPTIEDQELVDRFAMKAREYADHAHVVVAGTGFRAATHRSRITSNWRRRQEQGFASLHGSIEEAVSKIAVEISLSPEWLLREARARGLVA